MSMQTGNDGARKITVRALSLGERIDTAGLERPDTIATVPLAFHAGEHGRVALYRFGIAVLAGLSPLEEEEIVARLSTRVSGVRAGREDEETAIIAVIDGKEEMVPPGGPISIPAMTDERFLVIADALAKSVALGRYERSVNSVFDAIEPFAVQLAQFGRPPWKRRPMLELIGQALLVQHRVSGRIAVQEKPDILWDRPDLERLYARLNDEYELDERAETLKNKLDVIVETGRALTDVIEADRATRLEFIVILLIFFEIVLSAFQILLAGKH
ncbi:MAG: RMD1 family protein [Hyphomicrobiales bacterium]|nr:RMD1 family protein [Hyphomicrobiales bacterium]